MSRERAGSEDADVSITAGAKARRLRFGEEPETQTRFRGDASGRSFSESQRRNLPEKVRKGVEYREASIRWEASGWVAEGEENSGEQSAKGGVKKTDRGNADDQKPPEASNTQ